MNLYLKTSLISILSCENAVVPGTKKSNAFAALYFWLHSEQIKVLYQVSDTVWNASLLRAIIVGSDDHCEVLNTNCTISDIGWGLLSLAYEGAKQNNTPHKLKPCKDLTCVCQERTPPDVSPGKQSGRNFAKFFFSEDRIPFCNPNPHHPGNYSPKFEVRHHRWFISSPFAIRSALWEAADIWSGPVHGQVPLPPPQEGPLNPKIQLALSKEKLQELFGSKSNPSVFVNHAYASGQGSLHACCSALEESFFLYHGPNAKSSIATEVESRIFALFGASQSGDTESHCKFDPTAAKEVLPAYEQLEREVRSLQTAIDINQSQREKMMQKALAPATRIAFEKAVLAKYPPLLVTSHPNFPTEALLNRLRELLYDYNRYLTWLMKKN